MKTHFMSAALFLGGVFWSSHALAILVIEDDLGHRARIFDILETLSEDELTMDVGTGTVSWTYPHWWSALSSANSGTRLIRALIDSIRTIQVVSSDITAVDMDCTDGEFVMRPNHQVVRSIGSSSTVRIDLDDPERILTYSLRGLAPYTLTDQIESQADGIRFAFAHELIHALHAAYGYDIPNHLVADFINSGRYVIVENTAFGIGSLGYYTVSEVLNWEEAYAVGLATLAQVEGIFPGYSGFPYADITENLIRYELGGYERGAYTARNGFNVPVSEYYVALSWYELGTSDVAADGTSMCP